MNFIERVVRVMTHINIGAALGLLAWMLWSGWQVVTGQIAPAHRAAEVRALMQTAHAGPPAQMHLVPTQAGAAALPPCHEAPPSPRQAAGVLTGVDL